MQGTRLKLKPRPARKKLSISSRVDEDIVQRLDELADATGYTRSEIVNLSLREVVFKVEVSKIEVS